MINARTLELMGPIVSRASGMKSSVFRKDYYYFILSVVCYISAAAPAVTAVAYRLEGASVSTTVTSHTKPLDTV